MGAGYRLIGSRICMSACSLYNRTYPFHRRQVSRAACTYSLEQVVVVLRHAEAKPCRLPNTSTSLYALLRVGLALRQVLSHTRRLERSLRALWFESTCLYVCRFASFRNDGDRFLRVQTDTRDAASTDDSSRFRLALIIIHEARILE